MFKNEKASIKWVKIHHKNLPKKDFPMHHKAIKAEIRKQLKTRYPHWQRLTKKEKKAIAKKVLHEIVNNKVTGLEYYVRYNEKAFGIMQKIMAPAR